MGAGDFGDCRSADRRLRDSATPAGHKQFTNEVTLGRAEAERIRAKVILSTVHTVSAGLNFAAALVKFGLTGTEASEATAAAQSAFNLRQFRAGNTVAVGRSVRGELRQIDCKIDAHRMLHIVPDTRGFSAQVAEIPSHVEVETVNGRLEDSLFNAVEDAGESPEVALRLAQIFGYDLDFYTDPRKGDMFHVIIEKKKYKDGMLAEYGRILAAEYNSGGKRYQALLFHDEQGHAYGTPVGTPVQTIGSGRVEFAGSQGGDGNMVIRAQMRTERFQDGMEARLAEMRGDRCGKFQRRA